MADRESSYDKFIDIDSWKSQNVLSTDAGIIKQNRFICLLNAPELVIPTLQGNGWLEFQVQSVSCPNITLEMSESEINGVPRYYAKTRKDADLEISFVEGADLPLRRFFYNWMNFAFNQREQVRSYLTEYAAGIMQVIPLDTKKRVSHGDFFYHVFPWEVNGLDYDFTTEDTTLKTSVKFKYIFHEVKEVDFNGDFSSHQVIRQNTTL